MHVEVRPGFWIVAALWLLLVPLRIAIAVLLAAGIHELGHMAGVWITGGRIRSMELMPTVFRSRAA